MIDDKYLIHHGVKGMKWGVRRYEKKALVQLKANRRAAASLKKRGHEEPDDESFDILSPKEKAESRKLAKMHMENSLSEAKLWETAVSDIRVSKNGKAAKEIYKNAKKNARVFYPFG